MFLTVDVLASAEPECAATTDYRLPPNAAPPPGGLAAWPPTAPLFIDTQGERITSGIPRQGRSRTRQKSVPNTVLMNASISDPSVNRIGSQSVEDRASASRLPCAFEP
jgi:hypothetical protein